MKAGHDSTSTSGIQSAFFQASKSVPLLLKCLTLAVIFQLLIIGNVESNPGPTLNFVCEDGTCTFSTTSIKAHVKHQKIHSLKPNFFFKCPVPTCCQSFGTYSAAWQHAHNFHGRVAEETAGGKSSASGNQQVYSCSVSEGCKVNVFESAQQLSHHFIQHLTNNKELLPLECPFKCSVARSDRVPKFSSVSVFRTHLSVKHKGWKENVLRVVPDATPAEDSCSTPHGVTRDQGGESEAMDIDMDVDHEETYFDAEDGSDDDSDLFSFDNCTKLIGQFYLMLEGKLLLPYDTVDVIAEHTTFLSELVQIKTEQALKKELKNINVTPEKSSQIIQRVLRADPLFACHHKHAPGPCLDSHDRRISFYKKKFKFVDVVSVNACPRDLSAKQFAHYVPLDESLNMIIEDDGVADQIEESFNTDRDPEMISDYQDGSLYSDEGTTESIDMVLFIDAFNMVNPLGAAKNLYKTVGVYMTILNLKPFNRAKLAAMNLVMLVQEKYLEACNNHQKCLVSCSHKRCLDRLITDLNKLYANGVMFRGKRVPVRLRFIAGDSLGAHQLGGFLRNFSTTLYMCRFCEITRKEFIANPHITVGNPRTVENYQHAVHQLMLKRRAGLVAKSKKGIRLDSILNRINGFHVASPGLVPCLGHDTFLGCFTWDLRFIIDSFISKGWFSYDDFVTLLKSFKCKGSDSGNKPSSISKSGKKKGLSIQAVQVWFLVRMLSFLIGDKVKDKNDKVWLLYLKLKQVSEFICAPKLTRDQVTEMDMLIKNYLRARRRLKLKFRPKHHFLLHYAKIFLLYGPLIFLWGIRFESLHSIFKRAAVLAKNFINVTYTMALKYQLRFAYLLSGSLFKTNLQVSPKSVEKLSAKEIDDKTKDLINNKFSSDAVVTKSKWNDL